MPGLVPGIHVSPIKQQEDVDGRVKPGHDGECQSKQREFVIAPPRS
jgi:hypothetical protein